MIHHAIVRRGVPVALAVAIGFLFGLPSAGRAQLLDRHPLFGQDVIGNRAEIVSFGRVVDDSLPLFTHDFASDALSPLAPPAGCPVGGPGGFLDGLRAYWSFDDGFEATYGGSDYDGVSYGATIDAAEGRFGGSAYFERANSDYMRVFHPVIDPTSDHTYAAWYKETDGDIPDNTREFILETTGSYAISYGLRDDSSGGDKGQVYTRWPDGANDFTFGDATSGWVWPDGWHNIIVTYDASAAEHTIYYDGEFRGTMTSASALSPVVDLIIGAHRDPGNPGDQRHWDGWIDEVAFWDREFTAEEIARLQFRPVLGPGPGSRSSTR